MIENKGISSIEKLLNELGNSSVSLKIDTNRVSVEYENKRINQQYLDLESRKCIKFSDQMNVASCISQRKPIMTR